ncbi:MAG: Hsp70 family protein, partial [Firmicutes bacterium]|nr:Hsp70 family protein [Bacillota bacterium]
EVSFDIDANGIVNVSAKDLGTGREQKVTITASSGLSEEEIEKMIKESQKHAEEDRKFKELAEARNQADSLIYSTEKTIRELGDKVDSGTKDKVDKAIQELKDASSGSDTGRIKDASEKLSSLLHELSTKLYEQVRREQQSSAGGQSGGQESSSSGGGNQEDVVDADYEVVDGDEQK